MMAFDFAAGSLPRLLALATVGIMMAIIPLSSSFSNFLMVNHPQHRVNQQRKTFSILKKVMMRTTKTSLQSTLSDESTSIEIQQQRFSSLRSIGVDYGLVRTGVAVTAGGYRPRPLAILSGLDAAQLSSAIVDCVLSERATNVVLGLPLHKNGTSSEQSEITRTFGQSLLREVRCRCGRRTEVVLWDERYTSKEAVSRITAEAMARNVRIPSKADLGGELDADAACIILEDYYKEFGEDAERLVFENTTLAEECDAIYKMNLEREHQERMQKMEDREQGRNARREMMERVRALEEENGVVEGGSGKKKKKKKKKKK